MIEQPSSIAWDTCRRSPSSASFRAPSPASRSYNADSVAERNPSRSNPLILASSRSATMGDRNLNWRQCSGVSSNRFCSRPMKALKEVTSSSRMASRGGLVTWAKSCLK